jgi:diguanylate cyclase (GGDEF)-like protein
MTSGDTHFWLNHSRYLDVGPMDAHFVTIGTGAIDRNPATLGILLDMGPMLGGMSRHAAFFYGPVVLIGALALAVGSWWMRREVAGPISSLVRIAGKNLDVRDDAAVFERHKEFGALARTLHTLKLDALTWQRKAETTERRADTRVAKETKRITRDLHRVQRQAWIDQLTEVYNRRFLDEELPKVFDAQRGSNRDLAVVMIDLDHFKTLNDTAGHAAGDEVLRFTGELIKQCTRSDDFAVRYGGDEFLIVMPGATAARAMVLADRILAHFTQRVKMMVNVRPAPSLTAGVSSIANNQPTTLTDAIKMADEAMLEAKQDGKACVRISSQRGCTKAGLRVAKSA